MENEGVRIANNQGLVTTTAGPDLVHDMPTANPTTVKIRKIFWSNNTGANETIIFGTQTNAAVWVPLLPTITCINGFEGAIPEEEIPDVEFAVDGTVGAGTTGDIMVQASAVGILIRMEVEEIQN